MTLFHLFLAGLFHAEQHLHYMQHSGFRLHGCHYQSFRHATGHGAWRTIGRLVCPFQQNVHIVQPAGR
jgi:hypothetical protein